MNPLRQPRAGSLAALLSVLACGAFAAGGGAGEKLFVAKPLTADKSFTAGIEGPACDAAGNVYAVSFGTSAQTIGKVTPAGEGEVWVTLPGKSAGNGIVFDRNGLMYVADYVGHNVLRIDPKTRKITVYAHSDQFNQPNDLAIAPDGTLYASDPSWAKGTGQLWRIDTKGGVTRVARDMGTTNGIEVSPDGKTLYVNESVQRNVWAFMIGPDGTLSGKRLLKRFPDHGFDGMRCDVDGNLYITRHGKGTVAVLSPEGKVLREIDVLGKKPSNLCFGGPDGRTVYVTEVDHQRLVQFRVERPGLAWKRWQEMPSKKSEWKPRSDIRLPEAQGYMTALAFTPDSKNLIAGRGKTVRVFDLQTGRKGLEFDYATGGAILSIALSPGGELLAIAGTSQREIVLWDLAKRKEAFRLRGHAVSTGSVAFSEDGKTLLSYGTELSRKESILVPTDFGIRLWNVPGRTELKAFAGGLPGIGVGAISPNGKVVALGGFTGKITILEFASGKERQAFSDGHVQSRANITALAFSPDGTLLASGNGAKVCVWDARSGQLRQRLIPGKHAHGHITTNLCFTQNGQIVATGSLDTGSVMLWDTGNGREVANLKAERGDTYTIAISPDGHWLATAGWNTTIKLWKRQPVAGK